MDAYLLVPVYTQSEKYLKFCFKGIVYQFTSPLPFGLAMAPLIFTSIVKGRKLMALQSGIRLHQYLDDWCLLPLRTGVKGADTMVVKACEGCRLHSKPQEVRTPSLTDDQFLLDLALVKPMQDRWTKFREMFHRLSIVIIARIIMSTIGLLASTEKTVKLGRMHMRSLQWHLKTHWKFPLPLDTLMVVRPSKCVTRRVSPPQETQKK